MQANLYDKGIILTFTLNSETALNSLFEVLPINHPAKAPYSLFKQASDSVRSGVSIPSDIRTGKGRPCRILRLSCRNYIYGQGFHHVLKPDRYGTARFRAVK